MNGTVQNPKSATAELYDVFPALKKYKEDHTADNFQNLCVEITEFCQAVYASTRNDKERSIYQAMVAKIGRTDN